MPVPAATTEPAPRGKGNLRAMLLIGAGWTLLAAFDLWLILVRPDAPWDKKLSFLLGMIGIYTFAFGVVSGIGILDWDPGLGRALTGPHPTLLLAGIAEVLSVLLLAVALAFEPKKTAESFDRRGGLILPILQTPVIFLALVILIPFTAVYVFLVAPLAWIAYTIVSAPLDSLLTSASDTKITVRSPETGDRTLSIKQLVQRASRHAPECTRCRAGARRFVGARRDEPDLTEGSRVSAALLPTETLVECAGGPRSAFGCGDVGDLLAGKPWSWRWPCRVKTPHAVIDASRRRAGPRGGCPDRRRCGATGGA